MNLSFRFYIVLQLVTAGSYRRAVSFHPLTRADFK